MQSAVSDQVTPSGSMNVYWYIDNGSSCLSFLGPAVAFANFNGLTGKDIYPLFGGAWYPRWVPGTNYAAAVSQRGNVISVLDTPGATPWITDSNDAWRYFDISRAGNKVLIAMASTPDISSRSDLILWQNNGLPPATGSAVCALPGWGDDNAAPDISMPRWSPDGTQFTWADRQGVYVSPAPVAGAGGQCVINPKLIVAGGNSPD